MENRFQPGDVARHFKRQFTAPEQLAKEPEMYLYDIIGVAEHTESGEALMVYRPRYGERKLYARPLDMFLSPVDREKYPEAAQFWRFEKL